jgi:hypothetical protein
MTPVVITAAPSVSMIVKTAIIRKAVVIQHRDTKRELAITNKRLWTRVTVLTMKTQI